MNSACKLDNIKIEENFTKQRLIANKNEEKIFQSTSTILDNLRKSKTSNSHNVLTNYFTTKIFNIENNQKVDIKKQ